MGSGIIERAALAKRICDTVQSHRPDTELHILGCGNLLSFILFSAAGVAMCDGLEWCRTLIAGDFHLHHYQQRAMFGNEFGVSRNAAESIQKQNLPYQTAVAALNLARLQDFHHDLHENLTNSTVLSFVEQHFGNHASKAAGLLFA